MKLNFLRICAVAVGLTLFAGCVSNPEGNKHYGIPGMKRQFESRYERPVEQIFAAAKEVLRFNGTLFYENTISHSLGAKVDTRTVNITVDEVEPKISRVRVEAVKKSGLADPDLAAEIDKQIALKLK